MTKGATFEYNRADIEVAPVVGVPVDPRVMMHDDNASWNKTKSYLFTCPLDFAN